MLKKTTLFSAYHGFQCCSCPSSASPTCISNTSPQSLPAQRAIPQPYIANKRRRITEPSTWTQTRGYASARDGRGPDFRDNMNWPCGKQQGRNPFVPSPYEIFEMHKSATYSKKTKLKFYELVKIYHPDRSSAATGCESLTQAERLERYRLIVMAHEILSDQDKRRAYDAYGAGWGTRNATTRHTRGYSNAAGQQYGQGASTGFDSSPFGNATWEDWERWYRRNTPEYQQQAYAGTYVNPNAFAAFVIVVAVLSGILQATRATQLSGEWHEKHLAFTEETSRFMTQRASQFEENKLDKHGRVKHFLEKRDPTRYGLKEEEEVQYKKVFQDPRAMPPLGRSRSKVREAADET